MWQSWPSPPPEPSSTTQEVPYNNSFSSEEALDLSPNSRRSTKRPLPSPSSEEGTHVVPPSLNVPSKDEIAVAGTSSKRLKREGGDDGIWVDIKNTATPSKKIHEPEFKLISICADAYQEGHAGPIPIRTYGYERIVKKPEMEEEKVMKPSEFIKKKVNKHISIEAVVEPGPSQKKTNQEFQQAPSAAPATDPDHVVIITEVRPKRKRIQPSVIITKIDDVPVKKSKDSVTTQVRESPTITIEKVPIQKTPPPVAVDASQVKKVPQATLTTIAASPKSAHPVEPKKTSDPGTTTPKKRKVLRKRRKKSEKKNESGSPKILFSDAVAHSKSDSSEREISTSSEDESKSNEKKKKKMKSEKTVAASVDEHFQKSLGPIIYEQLFSKNNAGRGHVPLFQQAAAATTANQGLFKGSCGYSNAYGLRCCYSCGSGNIANVAMTSFSYLPPQPSNMFQFGSFPPHLGEMQMTGGSTMVQGTGGRYNY